MPLHFEGVLLNFRGIFENVGQKRIDGHVAYEATEEKMLQAFQTNRP